MSNGLQGSDVDYDLKVDAQVEKFLELKHNLSFFLVTAAVATLGYTVSYFLTVLKDVKLEPLRQSYVLLLGAAAVSGLLAAGSSLLSLHAEIVSYRFHLRYRYERKTFEQLGIPEQERWTLLNAQARRFEGNAFFLLFLSVAVQALAFVSLLVNGTGG